RRPAVGEKEALTAGAMRSLSHSRDGTGRRPHRRRETGRDFFFNKRLNKDLATWRNLRKENAEPGAPARGARQCKPFRLPSVRKARPDSPTDSHSSSGEGPGLPAQGRPGAASRSRSSFWKSSREWSA